MSKPIVLDFDRATDEDWQTAYDTLRRQDLPPGAIFRPEVEVWIGPRVPAAESVAVRFRAADENLARDPEVMRYLDAVSGFVTEEVNRSLRNRAAFRVLAKGTE